MLVAPGRLLTPAGVPVGGIALISGEPEGLGIDFTARAGKGSVAVRDAATPSNNRRNVEADSWLTNSGTSPKLVRSIGGTYAWVPHNLFLNSAAPATQNVTLITGATYTVTVTGAGGGSITGSVGASGVATTGSPATFVATGTSGTFTYAATLTTIQINRGTVATDYLATTTAIRYGIPIEYADGGYYMLSEPAATNLALQASDFTNASWVKTTMTTAKTATGPDGVANIASTLTASAGNATALQAITSANAARITHMFVKRRTGSGNIDMTQDNGGTWTTVTVTSDWTRVKMASVTSANPTVGIRIVTSSDAIDVAWFGHELGTVATSPIPTFASTVTRAVDNINVAASTFPFSDTAGSIVMEYSFQYVANCRLYIFDDGTTNDDRLLAYFSSPSLLRQNLRSADSEQGDILNVPAAEGTVQKYGAAWAANDIASVVDGGTVGTDAAATLPDAGDLTRLQIGGDSVSSLPGNYKVRSLVYLPRRVTNAELQSKTA